MADLVSAGPLHVRGLADLQRAFGLANRAVQADLRDALAESAAPVRSDAQSLAESRISHMRSGSPWRVMRIGVHRSVAYVAPVERGLKGRAYQGRRRPKFATLLLERSMQPALDRNREQVARRFEDMLDEVADVWERA